MPSKPSLVLIAALVGCSFDPSHDPDAPAIDPHAPRVRITSPIRGTIAGDVASLVVTGTVTDDSGDVAFVSVNDVPAAIIADGTWTLEVPVTHGTNLLRAVAGDSHGNVGRETRAVVAGPMTTLAQHVPNAITTALSPSAIAALGRRATTFIESDNLMTVVQSMNPVVDVGDGPDCLYAQASITSISVDDAAVATSPRAGAVFMAAELTGVRVGMHLSWAASCLTGSRDIVITTSRVIVQSDLGIAIAGSDFDVQLDDPTVQITGLDLQLDGVPSAVVDLLALDTTLAPILGAATTRFVAPVIKNSLRGLIQLETIDVLGTTVAVDVTPTQIELSPQGGIVHLHTSLRAQNDHGDFVFVPNARPVMDMSNDFELAIADDTANQLLTSTWSAKGMDNLIELGGGAYGSELAEQFDTVQLEVMVPPHIDASAGGLRLTVGDMVATFALGESRTQVAINADTPLEVVIGDDGKLRVDVSAPSVYIDPVDDAEDSPPLTRAQFDAIAAFARSRILVIGSATVGAIPLPKVSDVTITAARIDQRDGYLMVDADVQ